MEKEIIVKVRVNRHSGQKLVTIPKDCDILEGQFVRVEGIKWN